MEDLPVESLECEQESSEDESETTGGFGYSVHSGSALSSAKQKKLSQRKKTKKRRAPMQAAGLSTQ